ncbi:hypothetical protein VP01_144g3 [Puccinia sorghi]|uniref:Uncharacterized protein n=1 Tax=Puccinia sorghi TaxID=27349 RepID=A0A0L6VLX2_9BASI|nr:hypothetical protein VP01_144g3 [Puccinia sorghi]
MFSYNAKHLATTSTLPAILTWVMTDLNESHLKPHHNESQRYVFAHVVLGNFQFYEAEDWSSDMQFAQQMGIDAFAINIGRDLTNERNLPLIYEVAEKNSFHVFVSFDMVYYGKSGSSDDIIKIIEKFALEKSQFVYQGKPLISTFSGEVPGTFLVSLKITSSGELSCYSWSSLKKRLHFPIYFLSVKFLPCWTGIDPTQVPSVDGMLSWDAWCPVSMSQDQRYIENLSAVGKQYAAPLSAMFYKHLSASQNGNYLYPTKSWFLVEKYLNLISLKPDFIELLSWNDYGESHYLKDPRPSANLPMETISSATYVDQMPHEPLLDLISHFNKWYKSGTCPPIKRSKAYVWYRPHPKEMVFDSDLLPIPDGATAVEDKIYITILVSSTTMLQYIKIESGNRLYHANLEAHGTCKQQDVIILISIPFQVGSKQEFKFYDQNKNLLGCLVGCEIMYKSDIYNFNYWSGLIEL